MIIESDDIRANIKKYYSIVKHRAYNLPTATVDKDKQLQTLRVKQETWSNEALQFIYSCYLKDKYFDELDMRATGGEVLTEAKIVVNIVFPGYLCSLQQIMQIMLDFDNMLALSVENFTAWKQRSICLNDEQEALIKHRQQLIISKYQLKQSDVTYYRAQLNRSAKVQRSIDEICREVRKYIKKIHSTNEEPAPTKTKAVEVWSIETKELVCVYDSAKEASEKMQVSRSAISACCRHLQTASISHDGKVYTFRFVGDKAPTQKELTYKKPISKKVLVFDEDDNLLHKYNSIGEASRTLHIPKPTLRHALAHSGMIMSKGTLYKVSCE